MYMYMYMYMYIYENYCGYESYCGNNQEGILFCFYDFLYILCSSCLL